MRMLFVLLALVAAPAFAADTPTLQATPATAADKDRLVCKREVPIGSMIASRKRCLTMAQWERVAQDGNREAREMVARGTGRPVGE